MPFITFTTRDGTPWTPKYLEAIDHALCIGCGRCFKVCAQDVLGLMGITEDGEYVNVEDDDDDEGEIERKVMVITHSGNCIGCAACAAVCTHKAQKHGHVTAG